MTRAWLVFLRIARGVLVAAFMMALMSAAPAMAEGIVSGQVTASDTGLGLAGVPVVAYAMGDGSTVAATTTDSDGYYSLGWLRSGGYDLIADGSDVGYNPYAEFISVKSMPVYIYFNLVRPVPAITGKVINDATGAPVDGATLTAYQYDTNAGAWYDEYYADTDVTGSYAFNDMDPGSYRVFAEAPAYIHEWYGDAPTLAAAAPVVYDGSLVTLEDVRLGPQKTARVGGANRYDVAVNLASELDPTLQFNDVIVACGEDRAMADPLGAATLAAAYGCPVLLTPSARVNAGTMATIAAIRNANGGHVNIHVVGGTSSITSNVFNEIAFARGTGTYERLNGKNRYDLARMMAERVQWIAARRGVTIPGVFVVNIENAASFNDALAVSAIGGRNYMPLIGVKKSSVPAEATQALAKFTSAPKFALNSYYLDPATRTSVGAQATPIATSGNREVAATQIAKWGVDNNFATYSNVGLANKLSDALPAGGVLGLKGGVLLYTPVSPLSATTSTFMTGVKADVLQGWVFGGPATIAESTRTQFENTLE